MSLLLYITPDDGLHCFDDMNLDESRFKKLILMPLPTLLIDGAAVKKGSQENVHNFQHLRAKGLPLAVGGSRLGFKPQGSQRYVNDLMVVFGGIQGYTSPLSPFYSPLSCLPPVLFYYNFTCKRKTYIAPKQQSKRTTIYMKSFALLV